MVQRAVAEAGKRESGEMLISASAVSRDLDFFRTGRSFPERREALFSTADACGTRAIYLRRTRSKSLPPRARVRIILSQSRRCASRRIMIIAPIVVITADRPTNVRVQRLIRAPAARTKES